jgi:hypothetical protein
MPLVNCPSCTCRFRFPEEIGGKTVSCTNCFERFVVEVALSTEPTTGREIWYYQELNIEKGPVSFEALQRFAQEGKIGPETMVRRRQDGMKWVLASTVSGLGFPTGIFFVDNPSPEYLRNERSQQQSNPYLPWPIGGIAVLFVVLGVGLGVYLWEENVKLTRLLEDKEKSHANQLNAAENKANQLAEKLQDERNRIEGILREELKRREETGQRLMKLEEEIKRLNQELAAKAERGEKVATQAEGFAFNQSTLLGGAPRRG